MVGVFGTFELPSPFENPNPCSISPPIGLLQGESLVLFPLLHSLRKDFSFDVPGDLVSSDGDLMFSGGNLLDGNGDVGEEKPPIVRFGRVITRFLVELVEDREFT